MASNRKLVPFEKHLNGTSLLVLATLLSRCAYPPTRQELADKLGLSRDGVQYHINRLAALGLIERAERSARAVMVKVKFISAEHL